MRRRWIPPLRDASEPGHEERRRFGRAVNARIRARQPAFGKAIRADAAVCLRALKRTDDIGGAFHLAVVVTWLWFRTDAFFGQTMYRLGTHLWARRVPVLPRICQGLAMASSQLCIGSFAVIEPGVRIPHGQVVIDGPAEIGRGTQLRPWITIGLVEGDYRAPKIGRRVGIGTGSIILGHVTIGDGARIGANSVVLSDVPAHAVVAGSPARVLHPTPSSERVEADDPPSPSAGAAGGVEPAPPGTPTGNQR